MILQMLARRFAGLPLASSFTGVRCIYGAKSRRKCENNDEPLTNETDWTVYGMEGAIKRFTWQNLTLPLFCVTINLSLPKNLTILCV